MEIARNSWKNSRFNPNLILHFDEEVDVRQFLWERRNSVAGKDIFEENDYVLYDFDDPGCDANPFAQYLSSLCDTLPNAHIHEDANFQTMSGISETRIPSYRICEDIIQETTLGSFEASRALQDGLATIREIPEEFWTPLEASNRVKWLEEKYRGAKEDEPFV